MQNISIDFGSGGTPTLLLSYEPKKQNVLPGVEFLASSGFEISISGTKIYFEPNQCNGFWNETYLIERFFDRLRAKFDNLQVLAEKDSMKIRQGILGIRYPFSKRLSHQPLNRSSWLPSSSG